MKLGINLIPKAAAMLKIQKLHASITPVNTIKITQTKSYANAVMA